MSENTQYVSIPWGSNSNDYFYMDFSDALINGNIVITSDENNTGMTRQRVLTFKGAMPDETIPEAQAVAYLKIVQQVDNLIVATFENTTSIYSEVKAGYTIGL